MDILGSIMKKMEKPPAMGEKEKQLKRMQQEMLKKEQEEKERRYREFKTSMTEEIKKFLDDDSKTRHAFPPMDKLHRSMLYALAEDSGLVAHSFGREEVDKHVMVFKEGDVPSDAEMLALRRGEVYVPPTTAPEDSASTSTQAEDDDDERVRHKARRNRNAPPPEYLQKYEKQLGSLQFNKDAAMKAQADNRSYGFVSSEQKRDKRTIEETLADIRARKKQKPDAEDQS